MKDNLDEALIAEEDDLLFDLPHFASLDDNGEFPPTTVPVEEFTGDLLNMNDDELDKLLKEIIDEPMVLKIEEDSDASLEEEDVVSSTPLDEERALFEMEKHLEMEKIRLERQELENAKAKFEREKQEWENLRKLSEDSFQAEKEEYEKQKQLDREKMYLEAKELVNSCTSVRDFLDNYDIKPDVSE